MDERGPTGNLLHVITDPCPHLCVTPGERTGSGDFRVTHWPLGEFNENLHN